MTTDPNNQFQSFMGGNPYQSNPNWNGPGGYQNAYQQQNYGGFINRVPVQQPPSPSNIPVRVVFSPEQIAPQEIPTNGQPALFPLSDGSCIIAKSLLGNGLFDERVYVLQPRNQNENSQSSPSEFDQVMKRLDSIESSLNQVLGDLYGSKPQTPTTNQEGTVNKNE